MILGIFHGRNDTVDGMRVKIGDLLPSTGPFDPTAG